MQETRVRFLGWEDPLVKEMATHLSILAREKNPMNRETWWATVHGVTKSWTRLIDSRATFQSIMIYQEKAMAPHSSTLAWKIPWAEEPGRLQSMGSLRVGHD